MNSNKFITNLLASIGQKSMNVFAAIGRALIFLKSLLMAVPFSFWRIDLLFKQIYFSGVLSLPIILTAGFFVGMVLSLQGYYVLSQFNSEEAVGRMTALSLFRELGPVVTALLFAGRAGSAMTAEIGLMKSTEQLSALEMMAVNPTKYVYSPKFVATILTVPALALMFSALGILGAYLVSVSWLGVDEGPFWSQMIGNIDWSADVVNGIIKSVAFGFLIATVSIYQGSQAIPTSEGVSAATTRTVVHASLGILAIDFILTAFMLN